MKRYTKPIHVPKVMAHRAADSSLALINVVFLLLLFLLVSGTLRPSLPEEFEWAETTAQEGSGSLHGGIVLTRSGEVWYQGMRLDQSALEQVLLEVVVTVDRLPVQVDRETRVEAIAELAEKARAAGIGRLSLVTVEAGRP